MVGTTCAFTGHRPHKFPWKDNEADPRCIALKETLARQIATLAGAGVTEYFTGGADGTDCWAAEIVLDLREKNPALKLRCVLPYGGQADRWSDSARERYHSILKRADSVDYVSRQYYDGCYDSSPGPFFAPGQSVYAGPSKKTELFVLSGAVIPFSDIFAEGLCS